MASGNTLPASAIEFTTLSTVYEISKSYLENQLGKKLKLDMLPEKRSDFI